MPEASDFFSPIFYAAAHCGIADLFLFQKLLYGIEFRYKACHDDELPVFCHRGIKDICQRLQLGAAHGVYRAVVVGQIPTRNLRQAQEARENVHRRDFRRFKLCIAFCLDLAVNLRSRCFHLNCTDFLGHCR